MKSRMLFGSGGRKKARLLALFIGMIIAWGGISFPQFAAGAGSVDKVELPGVTGTGNNVAFAFDRYILVAPYAPSIAVTDETSLADLDNRFLYVIDTKKPNAEPKRKELTTNEASGESKTVYYPTRVLFDPETQVVYVRGTRFEKTDDGYAEVDVIAYLRLRLDTENKPIFDTSVVTIDLKGVTGKFSSSAPDEFALANKGRLLVFTNGASIFTFNIDEGYIYQVDIVPPGLYGEQNSISYIDVDRSSNTLVVSWNRNVKDDKEREVTQSEISFYQVTSDGILRLLKRAYSDNLPAGSYLTAGSNVVVTSNGETGQAEAALFVTSDGSLCQLELNSGEVSQPVRVLENFPELAQSGSGPASPRLLRFDPSSRVISIVRQGFTAQIRKPTNGKPGRRGMIRSLGTRVETDEPTLVLARLGKKNKISSSSVFSGDQGFKGGLTNISTLESGEMLLAGYTGTLYSVGVGAGVSRATLEKAGEIGTRIDRIDFFSTRTSVIAINSYGADETGEQIASPGAIVLAKLDGAAHASSFIQMLLPTPTLAFARPVPSIRRPCNVKK